MNTIILAKVKKLLVLKVRVALDLVDSRLDSTRL
jgi:hypothetical protein